MGSICSCCSSEGYEKLEINGSTPINFSTQPADVQDLGVPAEEEVAAAIADSDNDKNLNFSDEELEMFLEKLKLENFDQSKP